MPDILIRGMGMPKSCSRCDFASVVPGEVWCKRAKEIVPEEQAINVNMHPTFCPLHELPEHGDLKDANKLLAEFERDERAADEHGREFSFSFDSGGARCTEWWIVQQKLMDAPVIVPASEPTKSG